MKIKNYDGSNKLTRSNVVSVVAAFYKGLSYAKDYAPAGWDFEFCARLANLGTGIKKGNKEVSQFDRWIEKNNDIYQEAIRTMRELNLSLIDVAFMPETNYGEVLYSECATYWKPSITAWNENREIYIFEEGKNCWYQLMVIEDGYDVPCEVCEWNTVTAMGAFARFLRGLLGC